MARYEAAWETLAGFARTLAHRSAVDDVLDELADTVGTVLEVTGSGVSLLHDGNLRFATSDAGQLAELARVQGNDRRGPGVEALRTGAPVLVPQLADRLTRWPSYVARASQLGIAAVATIPIPEHDAIGTLDLCHVLPREWSEEDVRIAQVFGDVTAIYVVNASEAERQRRTSEQLQVALDSRVLIEQAKGIVAAQRGVSTDQAFVLLRKHANDRNATLRSVADAVVRLGLHV